MKAFLMIIGRNIQRRKTFSIVIVILSMFAASFLISAMGLIVKSQTSYESSYISSGESELIYGFLTIDYTEEYEKHFKEQASVQEVDKTESLLGLLDLGEEDIQTLFSEYESERVTYSIYGSNNFQGELSENEILVPMDFQDSYDFQVGDELKYKNTTFCIVGFYEDPICGSPFYHTKRILLSEEMFSRIKENLTENELREITFLNISLKEEYRKDLKNAVAELENNFEGKDKSLYSFNEYRLTTVRTMVPRIILAVLVLFALFLLGIMALVIRYAIMAAIEEDYRSLGIMKAIGFQGSNLIVLLLMQYLLLVLIGVIVGLADAYAVTPPIGSYLLATAGIVWIGSIDFAVAIAVSAAVLIFTAFIVYLQARKAGRIKPVEAIVLGSRKGAENKKIFPDMNKMPFVQIPISSRMGMKQLFSNVRQYVTLFLLVILFTFMVTNIAGLSNAFANEESVAGILGYDINDIKINVTNTEEETEKDIEELEEWIDSRYTIVYHSIYETGYDGFVDDMQIQLLGYSEFQTSNIIEGECPKEADEVMISSGVSEELEKGVGDTIEIAASNEGEKIAYRIVGINNQVYDLGKNISISQEGLELLMPDYKPNTFLLKIEKHENMQQIINTINEEYLADKNGISVSNERAVMIKRVNAIQTTLQAITIGVMCISLFLIALITFLVSIVMIQREMVENGIMKSIGFSSGQLRVQFVSRFLIVAISGSSIGIILSMVLDGQLINLLFSIVNLARVPSGVSGFLLVADFVFIVLAAVASAWLVSGRLRKVNVRVLLAD